MRKKILFCASTVSHIKNFHLPYIKAFHDLGYEVHVVSNEVVEIPWVDKVFSFPFYKSLLSLSNVFAIFQIRNFLKNEKYKKISTNTTLAGVIVRFAALYLPNRPFIYHIAHGYLFTKRYSLLKPLYVACEKLAATVSDVVMVMNQEDYDLAKYFKLYKTDLYMVNGMGVPLLPNQKRPTDRDVLRKDMGFTQDDFLFGCVADFSERKNQKILIQALALCHRKKTYLLLAGDGNTRPVCENLAKSLSIGDRVRFLGHIKHVTEFYTACDAAVSASKIEGLPFSIIEALWCGIPIVASDIKGHVELVKNGCTGFRFKRDDPVELANCFEKISEFDYKTRQMYSDNAQKECEKFLLCNVFDDVMDIYNSTFSSIKE